MENIATICTRVNGTGAATTGDVIAWVDAQKDKADLGGAGARMRTTSLRQMAEQVAPDEPEDARWLHDNMEQMRARWSRRNPEGKASTGNTYASRARATIREYFEWMESGGKHDPFSRTEKAKGAKSDAKPKKPKASAASAPEAPPAPYNAPMRCMQVHWCIASIRASVDRSIHRLL